MSVVQHFKAHLIFVDGHRSCYGLTNEDMVWLCLVNTLSTPPKYQNLFDKSLNILAKRLLCVEWDPINRFLFDGRLLAN